MQSKVESVTAAFAIYSESTAKLPLQVEAPLEPVVRGPLRLRNVHHKFGNYPAMPITCGHSGENAGHCGRRYH
jgi:hypothetical protein